MKHFQKIIALSLVSLTQLTWSYTAEERKQNAYQVQTLAEAEYSSADNHYRGLSHADFSAPAARTAFLSEGHVALYNYTNRTSNNLAFAAMTPYFKVGVSSRDYNMNTVGLIPSALDTMQNHKIESLNLGTGFRIGEIWNLSNWDLAAGVEYQFVQSKEVALDSVTYERQNLVLSGELQLGKFDLVAAIPLKKDGSSSEGRQDFIGRYHFQDQWEAALGYNQIVGSDIKHFYISTHKELYQMISLKAQLEWIFHYGLDPSALDQVVTVGTAIRLRPVEKEKVSTFMYNLVHNVPTWTYDWELGFDVVTYNTQSLTEIHLNIGRYF